MSSAFRNYSSGSSDSETSSEHKWESGSDSSSEDSDDRNRRYAALEARRASDELRNRALGLLTRATIATGRTSSNDGDEDNETTDEDDLNAEDNERTSDNNDSSSEHHASFRFDRGADFGRVDAEMEGSSSRLDASMPVFESSIASLPQNVDLEVDFIAAAVTRMRAAEGQMDASKDRTERAPLPTIPPGQRSSLWNDDENEESAEGMMDRLSFSSQRRRKSLPPQTSTDDDDDDDTEVDTVSNASFVSPEIRPSTAVTFRDTPSYTPDDVESKESDETSAGNALIASFEAELLERKTSSSSSRRRHDDEDDDSENDDVSSDPSTSVSSDTQNLELDSASESSSSTTSAEPPSSRSSSILSSSHRSVAEILREESLLLSSTANALQNTEEEDDVLRTEDPFFLYPHNQNLQDPHLSPISATKSTPSTRIRQVPSSSSSSGSSSTSSVRFSSTTKELRSRMEAATRNTPSPSSPTMRTGAPSPPSDEEASEQPRRQMDTSSSGASSSSSSTTSSRSRKSSPQKPTKLDFVDRAALKAPGPPMSSSSSNRRPLPHDFDQDDSAYSDSRRQLGTTDDAIHFGSDDDTSEYKTGDDEDDSTDFEEYDESTNAGDSTVSGVSDTPYFTPTKEELAAARAEEAKKRDDGDENDNDSKPGKMKKMLSADLGSTPSSGEGQVFEDNDDEDSPEDHRDSATRLTDLQYSFASNPSTLDAMSLAYSIDTANMDLVATPTSNVPYAGGRFDEDDNESSSSEDENSRDGETKDSKPPAVSFRTDFLESKPDPEDRATASNAGLFASRRLDDSSRKGDPSTTTHHTSSSSSKSYSERMVEMLSTTTSGATTMSSGDPTESSTMRMSSVCSLTESISKDPTESTNLQASAYGGGASSFNESMHSSMPVVKDDNSSYYSSDDARSEDARSEEQESNMIGTNLIHPAYSSEASEEESQALSTGDIIEEEVVFFGDDEDLRKSPLTVSGVKDPDGRLAGPDFDSSRGATEHDIGGIPGQRHSDGLSTTVRSSSIHDSTGSRRSDRSSLHSKDEEGSDSDDSSSNERAFENANDAFRNIARDLIHRSMGSDHENGIYVDESDAAHSPSMLNMDTSCSVDDWDDEEDGSMYESTGSVSTATFRKSDTPTSWHNATPRSASLLDSPENMESEGGESSIKHEIFFAPSASDLSSQQDEDVGDIARNLLLRAMENEDSVGEEETDEENDDSQDDPNMDTNLVVEDDVASAASTSPSHYSTKEDDVGDIARNILLKAMGPKADDHKEEVLSNKDGEGSKSLAIDVDFEENEEEEEEESPNADSAVTTIFSSVSTQNPSVHSDDLGAIARNIVNSAVEASNMAEEKGASVVESPESYEKSGDSLSSPGSGQSETIGEIARNILNRAMVTPTIQESKEEENVNTFTIPRTIEEVDDFSSTTPSSSSNSENVGDIARTILSKAMGKSILQETDDEASRQPNNEAETNSIEEDGNDSISTPAMSQISDNIGDIARTIVDAALMEQPSREISGGQSTVLEDSLEGVTSSPSLENPNSNDDIHEVARNLVSAAMLQQHPIETESVNQDAVPTRDISIRRRPMAENLMETRGNPNEKGQLHSDETAGSVQEIARNIVNAAATRSTPSPEPNSGSSHSRQGPGDNSTNFIIHTSDTSSVDDEQLSTASFEESQDLRELSRQIVQSAVGARNEDTISNEREQSTPSTTTSSRNIVMTQTETTYDMEEESLFTWGEDATSLPNQETRRFVDKEPIAEMEDEELEQEVFPEESSSPSKQTSNEPSRRSPIFSADDDESLSSKEIWELDDLLDRHEAGEDIDEDRLYELDLYDRWQNGEELTKEELRDLGDFKVKRSEERKSKTESKDDLPATLQPSSPPLEGNTDQEKELSLEPSVDERNSGEANRGCSMDAEASIEKSQELPQKEVESGDNPPHQQQVPDESVKLPESPVARNEDSPPVVEPNSATVDSASSFSSLSTWEYMELDELIERQENGDSFPADRLRNLELFDRWQENDSLNSQEQKDLKQFQRDRKQERKERKKSESLENTNRSMPALTDFEDTESQPEEHTWNTSDGGSVDPQEPKDPPEGNTRNPDVIHEVRSVPSLPSSSSSDESSSSSSSSHASGGDNHDLVVPSIVEYPTETANSFELTEATTPQSEIPESQGTTDKDADRTIQGLSPDRSSIDQNVSAATAAPAASPDLSDQSPRQTAHNADIFVSKISPSSVQDDRNSSASSKDSSKSGLEPSSPQSPPTMVTASSNLDDDTTKLIIVEDEKTPTLIQKRENRTLLPPQILMSPESPCPPPPSSSSSSSSSSGSVSMSDYNDNNNFFSLLPNNNNNNNNNNNPPIGPSRSPNNSNSNSNSSSSDENSSTEYSQKTNEDDFFPFPSKDGEKEGLASSPKEETASSLALAYESSSQDSSEDHSEDFMSQFRNFPSFQRKNDERTAEDLSDNDDVVAASRNESVFSAEKVSTSVRESILSVEEIDELNELLDREENGEAIDEDRIYELDLLSRWQIGEKLTADEMEDLQQIQARRTTPTTPPESPERRKDLLQTKKATPPPDSPERRVPDQVEDLQSIPARKATPPRHTPENLGELQKIPARNTTALSDSPERWISEDLGEVQSIPARRATPPPDSVEEFQNIPARNATPPPDTSELAQENLQIDASFQSDYTRDSILDQEWSPPDSSYFSDAQASWSERSKSESAKTISSYERSKNDSAKNEPSVGVGGGGGGEESSEWTPPSKSFFVKETKNNEKDPPETIVSNPKETPNEDTLDSQWSVPPFESPSVVEPNPEFEQALQTLQQEEEKRTEQAIQELYEKEKEKTKAELEKLERTKRLIAQEEALAKMAAMKKAEEEARVAKEIDLIQQLERKKAHEERERREREARLLEEQRKQQEETLRLAREKRLAEEKAKLEAERERIAEEARLAEEQIRAEKEHRERLEQEASLAAATRASKEGERKKLQAEEQVVREQNENMELERAQMETDQKSIENELQAEEQVVRERNENMEFERAQMETDQKSIEDEMRASIESPTGPLEDDVPANEETSNSSYCDQTVTSTESMLSVWEMDELNDLLDREENGEMVDENRIYELDLFSRYQIGEDLDEQEIADLNEFKIRRRNQRLGADSTKRAPEDRLDPSASEDDESKYLTCSESSKHTDDFQSTQMENQDESFESYYSQSRSQLSHESEYTLRTDELLEQSASFQSESLDPSPKSERKRTMGEIATANSIPLVPLETLYADDDLSLSLSDVFLLAPTTNVPKKPLLAAALKAKENQRWTSTRRQNSLDKDRKGSRDRSPDSFSSASISTVRSDDRSIVGGLKEPSQENSRMDGSRDGKLRSVTPKSEAQETPRKMDGSPKERGTKSSPAPEKQTEAAKSNSSFKVRQNDPSPSISSSSQQSKSSSTKSRNRRKASSNENRDAHSLNEQGRNQKFEDLGIPKEVTSEKKVKNDKERSIPDGSPKGMEQAYNALQVWNISSHGSSTSSKKKNSDDGNDVENGASSWNPAFDVNPFAHIPNPELSKGIPEDKPDPPEVASRVPGPRPKRSSKEDPYSRRERYLNRAPDQSSVVSNWGPPSLLRNEKGRKYSYIHRKHHYEPHAGSSFTNERASPVLLHRPNTPPTQPVAFVTEQLNALPKLSGDINHKSSYDTETDQESFRGFDPQLLLSTWGIPMMENRIDERPMRMMEMQSVQSSKPAGRNDDDSSWVVSRAESSPPISHVTNPASLMEEGRLYSNTRDFDEMTGSSTSYVVDESTASMPTRRNGPDIESGLSFPHRMDPIESSSEIDSRSDDSSEDTEVPLEEFSDEGSSDSDSEEIRTRLERYSKEEKANVGKKETRDNDSQAPTNSKWKRILCYSILCLFILGLIGGGVAAGLIFLGGGDDPPPTNPPIPVPPIPMPVPTIPPITSPPVTSPPVVIPTTPPSISPKTTTPTIGNNLNAKIIALVVANSPDGGVSLRDPNSPQSAALSWLQQPINEKFSDARLLQRYALATLYYSTNLNNDSWKTDAMWLTEADECNWFSTTETSNPCATDSIFTDTYTSLDLRNNGLVGRLPAEVSMLSSLRTIRLPENSLKGTIPAVIATLPRLEYLDLSSNQFGVKASPNVIAQASYLHEGSRNVRSSENVFGSVETASATAIGTANEVLDGNFLYALRNMRSLMHLDLNGNSFQTTLPVDAWGEKCSLSSTLKVLNFGSNRFYGTMPTEIGFLTKLTGLSVFDNALSGQLPESLSRLSMLELLYVDSNDFRTNRQKLGVPQAICEELRPVPLKEFWADCQKTDCACCTTCCSEDLGCVAA